MRKLFHAPHPRLSILHAPRVALLLSCVLAWSSGCESSPSGSSTVVAFDPNVARDASLDPAFVPDAHVARPSREPIMDAGAIEAPPPADVEVVITTDNAFSFGYGNAETVTTFMQGVPSGGPEIFACPVDYGPQSYVVPGEDAPDDAYLYIIAWSDSAWTQGALAQFKRVGGAPIYSGDGKWEVCATGMEFDGLGNGPDHAVVNTYLAQCNAGAAGMTFSKGWVDVAGAVTKGAVGKLAYGEANDDPAGDFPLVCQADDAGVAGIDPAARWMWFDPVDGTSPFRGNASNRTKTFLIFRLPADVLVVL